MPKTKASLLVIAATAATVVTLFLLPFTPRTAVRTAVVERRELICSTLLEGVVAYADEQPLIALQAGRVGKVYVCQGQTVRAGELLISMDTGVLVRRAKRLCPLLKPPCRRARGRRNCAPPSPPRRFAQKPTASWGPFTWPKALSPERAAFWDRFMEPGCGSSPPDARRNWQM